MFRLLILFVTFAVTLPLSEVAAQGRSHRSYHSGHGHMHSGHGAVIQRYDNGRRYGKRYNNYHSYRPSSSIGISIGIGGYPGYGGFGYFDPYRFDFYGYDPYRFGSFEAPDLLNDPYFRERHRYDSKYPGRYRAPLVMRAAPVTRYEAGPSVLVETPSSSWVDPNEVAFRLQTFTTQLLASLQAEQHGQSWIEYLTPGEIPALVAAGETGKLRELLTHYDGVVGNPQLRSVAMTKGFAETHGLLRKILSRSGRSMDRSQERNPGKRPQRLPVPETLPAPAPEAELETTSTRFLDV